MNQLHKILDDVSNPKSQNYGKYLTHEEVGKLTGNPNGKAQVLAYLSNFVDHSQISSPPHTNFIRVQTDISTAEKILKAKYYKFTSKSSDEQIFRTLEYELPADLVELLDYVSPTTDFPPLNPPKRLNPQTNKERDSKTIYPNKLSKYYQISSNTVKNQGATQAVYVNLNQSYSPDDLKAFQKNFGLPKDTVDEQIGYNSPEICPTQPEACSEANLDFQYLMSVAQLAPTTFWRVSGNWLTWIESVAADPHPPLVISISYGQPESSAAGWAQQSFSDQIAQLTARGVTVVAASGDDGIAGPFAVNNASRCNDPFSPMFPTNVPYILSVGATMGPEIGSQEVACQADKGSSITSGGGFSNVFPTPSYQKSAVNSYLKNATVTGNTIFPTGKYNVSGRAVPDVSIAGNVFEVVIGGKLYTISGTSASAPVWAGIITLANNARLNKGKSPLGFVNPALYDLYASDPSIFNDVTTGDNRCTSLNTNKPTCCTVGFPCAKGWDPVTGLGSVNVDKLVKKLVKL